MNSSEDDMRQAISAKNEASDTAAKRPRNLLSSLTGVKLNGIFSRSQPPPHDTYTSQWLKDSAMTAGDIDVLSVASNDSGLETEAQVQKLGQLANGRQESSGSVDEDFTDLSGEEEFIEIRERFQREAQAVPQVLDQPQAGGDSVQTGNSNQVLEQQIHEHMGEIDVIFGNERQHLKDIIALRDTRICELVRDSETAWKENTSLKSAIKGLSASIKEKEKSYILQTRKLENLEEHSLQLHQAKAIVQKRERRIKKLEVDFETAKVSQTVEVDKLQKTMKGLEESHNTAIASFNREFEEMVARQREILDEKEAEIAELMQRIYDAKHDKDEQDKLNCEQIRKLQAEHESTYRELAQRYDNLAEENLKQAGAHYAVVSELKEKHEQAIKIARQEPEKAIELAKQAVIDEKDKEIFDLMEQVKALQTGQPHSHDWHEKEIQRMGVDLKNKDERIKNLRSVLDTAYIECRVSKQNESIATQAAEKAGMFFRENTTLKARVVELENEVINATQLVRLTKDIMHRDSKNMAERAKLTASKKENEIQALSMAIQENYSQLKALNVQNQEKDAKILALKVSNQEKDEEITALKIQIEELSADQALEIALHPGNVLGNTFQTGSSQDTEALQQQIQIQADHIKKLTSMQRASETTITELRQTICDHLARISMQNKVLLEANTYAQQHKRETEEEKKLNNELLKNQHLHIEKLQSQCDAARREFEALQRQVNVGENSAVVDEREFSDQNKFLVAQLTQQKDNFQTRTKCLTDSLEEEKNRNQNLRKELAMVVLQLQAEQSKVEAVKEKFRNLIYRVKKSEIRGLEKQEKLINVD